MRTVRSPMLPLDARGPYAQGAGGWPWLALLRRDAGAADDAPAALAKAQAPLTWAKLHRIFVQGGR